MPPLLFLFFFFLPSYLLTFYTYTPLSIWASWVPSPSASKSPPSAWKTHPPLFLLHLQGQLTPFSFQLASPPRIHMDSWWAARNPNQGPKWAHNIAQNRSGAYGPEPCRIWVPKLPKSVFYTSWLDEPIEPAEPDANRSNWMPTGRTGCKKFWKFDRMFLEEWGIHKKNGMQFRVRKREIWSK